MKNQLFLTRNGKLFSKSGTIAFVDEASQRFIFPLKNIDSIFCMGNISLTSGIIKRVLRNEISIHFLSSSGTYLGSLSSNSILDGKLIINQVKIFTSALKGQYSLELLKAMKESFIALFNKFGYFEGIDLLSSLEIKGRNETELMGIESQMWRAGYEFLKKKLINFDFYNREYHPPKGEINALISFINSLIYSQVLSLIREVGLLPEIGFLHSSKQKRFSLVLDIADMFKPIITFKLILDLDKEKKINKYDFDSRSAGTYLNETGKFTVVQEFRDFIHSTFYFDELKRNISFRMLIKSELLKIKNSLLNHSRYSSFKRWDICL